MQIKRLSVLNCVDRTLLRYAHYGDKACDKRDKHADAQDQRKLSKPDVKQSQRKAVFRAYHAVNNGSGHKGHYGSQHKVDQSNDKAFVEEYAEYVAASCAHRAQYADFALFIRNRNGNEIKHHQRGEHRKEYAYVQKYLRQRFHHAVD